MSNPKPLSEYHPKVQLYFSAMRQGLIKLSKVPKKWRAQVKELCIERGVKID